MLDLLAGIARYIDALNEWCGRLIAWLTGFMVAVTFLIVVLRYMFNTGWIAMQESVVFMHALVFLIGAAYTLRHDAHVRVDIFYRGMSPHRRAWVDLLGCLLLLFPVCIYIFWFSYDYVYTAWRLLEGSREAGGLPGVYLLKTSILIMSALLILQGISQCLHSILVINNHTSVPDKQGHDIHYG